MKKILLFFTSNYPFGNGETFIENEMPYLAEAFDQIVLVSNDTASPQTREVPANVRLARFAYELAPSEKKAAIGSFFSPYFWQELWIVVKKYGLYPNQLRLNSLLISWYKANKTAAYIRNLASAFPDENVVAYSYWANDMALGCAIARKKRWVQKAVCRAHGWDVYFERAETGFLPFRNFLADHLDHYSFISESGLSYTQQKLQKSFPSFEKHYLGVPKISKTPIARLQPFRLVSCSSLISLKRVHLLAEALLQVNFEVEWTHIGDGPERTKVEKIIAQFPEKVKGTLLGNLPNREVISYYQSWQPSVFVNVSETEGVPVSIMEAMSCGITVIATDVGGVSELVEEGKNGVLLSASFNTAQLVEVLHSFTTMDEADYQKLAEGAYGKWKENFSAEGNYSTFAKTLVK